MLEVKGHVLSVASKIDGHTFYFRLIDVPWGSEFSIPEDVQTRARLKSDAMRLLSKSPFRPRHTAEDMQGAITLLSKALDAEELRSKGGRSTTSRRKYELLMLRGKAWGRLCLAKLQNGVASGEVTSEVQGVAASALADFGAAVLERPKSFEAIVEAAHIYAFSGESSRAVDFYQKAIELMKEQHMAHECARLQRRVDKLLAGSSCEVDSGDGSGLWKVEEIRGVSGDTCVYHLRAAPPGNPHPYPESAWHVQVFVGPNVREYTPISSVSDWEDGAVDLLVKTYPDGEVSRFFGTLRTVEEAREASLQNYAPLEEQNCWVRLSAPLLTLQFPSFSEDVEAEPVEELGLIVGGTGIAPALQVLFQCLPGGTLEKLRKAVLLYSSRSPQDILMLEELKWIEDESEGRVQVRHTLTAQDGQRMQSRCYFSGRHGHFLEDHQPDPPPGSFQGHIDREMLRKVMPPKGPRTRILVCGHLPATLNSMSYPIRKLDGASEHSQYWLLKPLFDVPRTTRLAGHCARISDILGLCTWWSGAFESYGTKPKAWNHLQWFGKRIFSPRHSYGNTQHFCFTRNGAIEWDSQSRGVVERAAEPKQPKPDRLSRRSHLCRSSATCLGKSWESDKSHDAL